MNRSTQQEHVSPGAPRILVVTVLFVALLVTGLYWATRAITVASYEDIERREVLSAVDRSRDALSIKIDGLSRTAGDYAEWDDAYAFTRGQYPAFLTDNCDPGTMNNLTIDFMAVVWPAEGRVEGMLLDTAHESVPLSLEFARELNQGVSRAGDPLTESPKGVLVTRSGAYLIGTNPIRNTDRTASAAAYLVVGRAVSAGVANEVSALTHLSTRFLPPDATRVAQSATTSRKPTRDIVTVKTVSDIEAHGAVLVRSITNDPAFVVRVAVPRTVHSMGEQSLTLLGFALTSFGVVTCLSVGRAIQLQQREVMQRKRAEESLRTSEERHRSLITRMPDAILGIAADGHITFANPEAERMTGLTAEQLHASSVDDLMTAESVAISHRRLDAGVNSGSSESFELDLSHVSGRTVPVEINSSPMTTEDGTVTGVQWIARDVTDRKRFEQELVLLANQDYLTGLANRRRFEDELSRQIEHSIRSERSGAVLWLDIDSFKDINDGLGHQVGDRVLVALAKTIASVVRADSLLARLGGDEFAVMLPEVGQSQAEECAERVLEAIRGSSIIEDRKLTVTASMGVVLFPAHGAAVEDLLARADLAMYHSKEQGRNQFCVYNPGKGWEAEQKARLVWTERIDRALIEDRFLVFAQPVVRLTDGGVDRYELLIRMESDEGRILQPAEFLPLAERTGRIRGIDRWMVRRAIDLISMRTDAASPFRLDINLSGRAFSDADLLPLIQSELIRTGIDPSLFGVEVTETSAVTDMGKAREFIGALRKMGCRVALDDFGSGFSSFYYLKNLPIDSLKIDGSFVQHLTTNLQDQHVVRAMVELSEGFGIDCTAEYVESQETFDLLRSYGVTHAQGYHIARPVPVTEI